MKEMGELCNDIQWQIKELSDRDANPLLLHANEFCEGYVFMPVCQSFCSQDGVCSPGVWGSTPGGCKCSWGSAPRGCV